MDKTRSERIMRYHVRRYICLNDNWTFTAPDKKAEQVQLPHTWNALDGQDGGNDYQRGSCLYEKKFDAPIWEMAREQVYLEFRGVNASADVTINGYTCMHHDGGYSTFRVNITPYLKKENILEVWVDNGVNDRVYPQKADFTFYGGIYRDVFLLIVDKYHFELENYGGPGVQIDSKVKNSLLEKGKTETKEGIIHIVSSHNVPKERERDRGLGEFACEDQNGDNQSDTVHSCKHQARVGICILDKEGQVVATGHGEDSEMKIPRVHLWDGTRDPYLYTAVLQLKVDQEIVDEISCRFGVREFFVDPQKGFFLNGRSYPLRGVCRHQDRAGIGNALQKAHHREDMELIREVGANAVRLAHYQHDQYFYDLCDEYGMVVWAEIPYISSHMPGGRGNTFSQMRELIIQNYNHPSIVTWGISNEITIATKDKKDMLDNHRKLNDLCHELDGTRPTSLACYAMCSPFNKVAHITDLVSWNLYLGWYVPGLFLNDLWISFFHFCYPKRPIGFAEYGCEAMTNLHSLRPKRGDHCEEYQVVYHHFMLECFRRHPYMWANFVWNMFDFAADARDQGGEPGMNHKGLVTFDRKIKKDSFYLYKAYWSEVPFVRIGGSRYVERSERVTRVTVFSNQKKVRLFLNGQFVAEGESGPVFEFEVELEEENVLCAEAEVTADTIFIRHVERENPKYKLQGKSSNSANWV